MAEEDQQQQQQLILPIIDSHIHLYRTLDVENFKWWSEDVPMRGGGQFLPQFKQAARSAPSLLGFVYVETGCEYDLAKGAADGSGWELPLKEVGLMRRVALGEPSGEEDQGLEAEDGKLCLGLVPWAPVPSGAEVMERYIDRVKEEAGEAWPKVKGFRFLMDDEPHGTMLGNDFIESLKLLGRKGLIFEVGINHHRRGKKQLDELLAMIDQAHDGVPYEERVTFVISTLPFLVFPVSQWHASGCFI